MARFLRKSFKIDQKQAILASFCSILLHFWPISSKNATFLRNLLDFIETGSEASLRPRPSAKSFAFDAFGRPLWPKIGLKLRFCGLFWPFSASKSFAFGAFPAPSSLLELVPRSRKLSLVPKLVENLASLGFLLAGEHNAPLIRFAHEPPLAACELCSLLRRERGAKAQSARVARCRSRPSRTDVFFLFGRGPLCCSTRPSPSREKGTDEITLSS